VGGLPVCGHAAPGAGQRCRRDRHSLEQASHPMRSPRIEAGPTVCADGSRQPISDLHRQDDAQGKRHDEEYAKN